MKILLATDGSDTALAAVDFLLTFPLPPNTEFTVLTVIKKVLRSEELQRLSTEQRTEFEDAYKAAEVDAQSLLDDEIQRLRRAGYVVDGTIHRGDPAEQIVRLATERRFDLVAVGSHGLSGPKRFLLGSVSDRVFEYAPCSVLIVKRATTHRKQAVDAVWRLLLAFDDSPPARKAVEFCASLPLGRRARIKAVTALPLIRLFRQDIRQQLSWVWHEKKRAAAMALERLTTDLDGTDIEVVTALLESSDVAQAILDGAIEDQSDLIIVGHKGKKAFERFLLGSVTARIAHHARCSVLSIRDRR